MTAGSALGVLSILLVAAAPNLPLFTTGWLLAGAAMAAAFNPPAFAAFTRWYAPDHIRALTLVTLAGGLASTVFARPLPGRPPLLRSPHAPDPPHEGHFLADDRVYSAALAELTRSAGRQSHAHPGLDGLRIGLAWKSRAAHDTLRGRRVVVGVTVVLAPVIRDAGVRDEEGRVRVRAGKFLRGCEAGGLASQVKVTRTCFFRWGGADGLLVTCCMQLLTPGSGCAWWGGPRLRRCRYESTG